MQVLETITSTFRGRRMSFAQLQASSSRKSSGKPVEKWAVYKQLCIAKHIFGVNDRCLAVLSSLLSFYPENEISEKNGLIVFPSNRQLSLRAHGMAESTLRRHLASLVDAGLIARRDSPNGKRYAYKDRGGEVEEAFGFSFAPLLYRANEIAQTAERVLADAKLLKRTRERITLQRRDLAQMFEAALEETPSDEWKDAYQRFRAIVNALPRRAPIGDLEAILEQFTLLRAEIDNLLISIDNVQDLSVNERQYERQQYESLPESLFESKNIQKIDLKGIPTSKTAQSKCVVSQSSADKIPLDMVLRACPDIRDYAPAGISCWRDLIEVSRVVSGFLGIARSAYLEASQTMSLEGVSAVVAWLLQRAGEIQAPGGYLRSLTQKARGGGFSIVQVLMTGLKANAPRAG